MRASLPHLVLRKLTAACLTMLGVSVLIFLALEVNGDDVAVKVLGPFSASDQRQAWLHEHGYMDPLLVRYFRWVITFVAGDWGISTYYREHVFNLIPPRLAASGMLALGALAISVPAALILGVIAAVTEGSVVDRAISSGAIMATSIPEFASAAFLSALFVFWLGWLPGASTMTSGFSLREFVLPTIVLSLSPIGYIARITRASMIEVLNSPYIYAARMKGCPRSRIILRHALRNALSAPVTLILLHVPWLLSNVVIVEVFFAYKGFGTLLYEASLNSDIRLIEACAMVSVVVVVATHAISDFAYAWLTPKAAVQQLTSRTER